VTTAQYGKVTVQGHTLDNLTAAYFRCIQAANPDDPDWTLIKGSYVEGDCDTGSSCTHGGGGAMDVSAFNHEKRVHIGRAWGGAAFYRPPNWDGKGGEEHIHIELLGNIKATPQAKAQWAQYINYTDGLANAGPDNTWHPFPKGGPPLIFKWRLYQQEVSRVANLKAAIRSASTATEKAISNAQNDKQADTLRAQARALGNMRSDFRFKSGLYVVERSN